MATTDRPEQRLHIPRVDTCPACTQAGRQGVEAHNEAAAFTGERTYNGALARVPVSTLVGRGA